MAKLKVVVRRLPEGYDPELHELSRNNIREKSTGKIVDQLEELGSAEKEDLAKLCGGDKRLDFLNAAGSITSVLNLGVSVIGFMHVSELLRRIEDRIEGIETKLDELGELVGVIDQKVDQLIELNEVQVTALARVHDLIVSFETARVHAALETLDFLSSEKKTPQRDKRLIDAAETLQVFRSWLADKRDSTAESAMAVRTELLRAEVAVVLAECRARCLAGDVSFAGRMLDGVMRGAAAEVERTHEWITKRHGTRHLISDLPPVFDPLQFQTNAAVEAVAWMEGVSMIEAAFELLYGLREDYINRELQFLFRKTQVEITVAELIKVKIGARSNRDLLEYLNVLFEDEIQSKEEELRGAEKEDDDESCNACDATAFVASYHLVRDLEAARAMCAAMELFGEPVQELLSETAPPSSPALVLEWRREVTATT